MCVYKGFGVWMPLVFKTCNNPPSASHMPTQHTAAGIIPSGLFSGLEAQIVAYGL